MQLVIEGHQMAYVSYGSARDFQTLRGVVLAPIFMRSAIVAVAAAAAILALSETSATSVAANPPAASAKGDRISISSVPASPAAASFYVDVADRTTTVERGASVPLNPGSPFMTVSD